METPFLSASQVCRLSGASYRQIDYWARTGALRPSTEARGSGSGRRYTRSEAIAARVLVVLSLHGGRAHVMAAVSEAIVSGWLPALALVSSEGRITPIGSLDHLGDGWIVDMAAAESHVAVALGGLVAA